MALEVKVFPVGDLARFHKNPRRGAVAAIAESLQARGLYRPIVVNVGTHTGRPFEILAGNHTYAAAVSLGWESIEATTVDVDDEAAAQIVLADNRLADLGEYDSDALAELMQDAGDLEGTGYTDGDLAALIAELDEPVALTEPDAVPDVPVSDPVSRVGDVWDLGPHRLLVGSSGDLDAVRAACPGVVDAVWTDPPYGVNYVGGSHVYSTKERLKRGGKAIDNDGPAEAVRATLECLEVAVAIARGGAPVYVAHSDVLRVPLQVGVEGLGIRYRQTLQWVKDRMVMGRSDYHYRHEPIMEGSTIDLAEVDSDFLPFGYGFLPGGEGRLGRGGDHWHGDNRPTTVFEVPRPTASRIHPTMKPVELVERMLRNSVAPGGIVFDGFAGSGSTLIACHRLGARAFLVELDPVYADVICRRWQEHTGVTPVRDGVEVSFVGGGS